MKNKIFMPLNIQRFADGGEGENANQNSSDGNASKKTLVELLKENPELQSEFDKLNAKSNETAIKNAKEAWNKEAEEKKNEATRLAKLGDEERHKEELAKEVKARESAEAKLNAYELKNQAIKDNPDLPIELIELIDFSVCNTADKVQEKLDTIKNAYKKSVENGINEAFKENTPKTVVKKEMPATVGDKNRLNPIFKNYN